jgi:hypothetical protein
MKTTTNIAPKNDLNNTNNSRKNALKKIQKSSRIIKKGLSNLYYAITQVIPVETMPNFNY